MINSFDGTFNINWTDNRGFKIDQFFCDCNIIDKKKAYNYVYDGKTICVNDHVYTVELKHDTLKLTESNYTMTFIKSRVKCF